MDRSSLFENLSSIPQEQLLQIIFILDVPQENIPSNASQGQQVNALLRWAKSKLGCGLEQVEATLNRIIKPTVNHPESEQKPKPNYPNTHECPYKGLLAFGREDAKFFFGREKFTEKLIESVNSQPFLAIIGNSGMGKSSVVFAGLIPELEKLGNWDFITFRLYDNPISKMAESLLNHFKPTKNESRRIERQKKYVAKLRSKELTLGQFLDDEITGSKIKNRLLIVVDQFEEIYTLSPEDQREIFIENLLEVINSQSHKETADIVIIITLRVDFLGFALDYQPLAEILQKFKPEPIIGMNREELKSAIEGPAKEAEIKIEDGLTNMILDEIINTPGELPLLEFALCELFNKRSDNELKITTYVGLGGFKQALAEYAESIYEELDQDQQEQVKHIFTQLVRFGEQTENTRRLATYSQIGAENWKLVTALANDRLVVTGYDEVQKQSTVEVVHEVLIRGWKRLQEWMEEDQDFRKWQDRLRFEMKTWEETNRNNSVLLRGALLVEAEDWLKAKSECITDQKEIEFINASRQYQEQEDIANIENLLELSQKELQLQQQLRSLFYAVKAGVKLGKIQEPSEELKRNVIERLQQGSYGISERNQLIGHTGEVNGVAFSPDGSMIASVSDDQTVRLWNSDGELLRILKEHTDDVLRVSFSPDGQMIASSSGDKTIKLWSVEGKLLHTLVGHTDRVWGVSFSPDGQKIASASFDRTVRLWSVEGKLLQTLEGHSDRVYGVSFSPDGQIIASASVDRTVRLWTVEGKPLQTLEGHTDQVHGVSFSPDGQSIASASFDRTVRLWTVEGKLLQTLEGHTDQVYGVSFSPDGQSIVSAGLDRTVRLWSVEGKLLRTLEGHTGRVWEVSFSPDGQSIASASFDRTVRLWSVEGKLLQTLEGHSDRVYGVSFSPDGQIIASASVDRTVRLWSVEGKPLQTLEGHTDQVYGVSFSPDGQSIASASLDRTVRLWSVEGDLLHTLEGHTDRGWGVSFSPDGQSIASGSFDQTVRLWHIDPDDLILDLDIKLNNLLRKGCHWIRDYLKTNPNVSESDRNLVEGWHTLNG